MLQVLPSYILFRLVELSRRYPYINEASENGCMANQYRRELALRSGTPSFLFCFLLSDICISSLSDGWSLEDVQLPVCRHQPKLIDCVLVSEMARIVGQTQVELPRTSGAAIRVFGCI